MVDIMLPASVGGALANIATLLAGKVPVNLNFTAGRDAVRSAVEQCQIKTVLTSRVFLAKAKIEQPEGACFLEDVLKSITQVRKIGMLMAGLLLLFVLTPLYVARRRRDRQRLERMKEADAAAERTAQTAIDDLLR